MKNIYFTINIVLLLVTIKMQSQEVNLTVWKFNEIINEQNIDPAVMDSITFRIPTIQICNQVWAARNLTGTTYSDGTPIPQVTDPNDWANLTTGAWCYYDNDPSNNSLYGKLYNWYAVAGINDAASLNNPALRKNLAPLGWHVPTDAEWTTLTDCLGGEPVAGGKMKAITLWSIPNVDATDFSGFTGFPGGTRYDGGGFDDSPSRGNWWSSTESDGATSFYRFLRDFTGATFRSTDDRNYGFSVRCIKD